MYRTIRTAGLEEWRYSELAEVRRQKFQYSEVTGAYDLSQTAAEGKNSHHWQLQHQQQKQQQKQQRRVQEQHAAGAYCCP